MTAYQSFMLSVCFGATVGMLISGTVFSIKCWIENRREKKRLAEEAKAKEPAEGSDN